MAFAQAQATRIGEQSSHQCFHRYESFFQNGGFKSNKIIKYSQKSDEKYYLSKCYCEIKILEEKSRFYSISFKRDK